MAAVHLLLQLIICALTNYPLGCGYCRNRRFKEDDMKTWCFKKPNFTTITFRGLCQVFDSYVCSSNYALLAIAKLPNNELTGIHTLNLPPLLL